jgi:hypothetical protein
MADPVAATAPAAPPAAAPPPQSAPPPAARPGSISAADYHRLDPAEQGKFANLPDGVWIERSKLETERAEPGTTAAADATTTPTLAPGEKYKFGDVELTGQEISDLLKFKGESELRRAAVPTDANGYRIELPKDFTLPAGMDFKFNEADPALAAARAWSHKVGLSQDQFADLLGQYASMKAAEDATFKTAMKGELDKLGVNATMRVTALETWLKGMVPGDVAKSMVAGLFSEKQVRGLELIATKMASQGAATFSQAHREPPARRAA